MIGNSIILASNCKTNNNIIKEVKKQIKTKFKNEKNIKISMILTAKMRNINIPRQELWQKAIKYCDIYEKKINIQFEYIDCSSKENLKKFKKSIKTSNIIWVLGGDTIYLWYHLKKTGMDKLIYHRIKNENVLYIGCCAGAIIAGETIIPAFISRLYDKSKKYYIRNTYKKNWIKKKQNQKTLNLIPKTDILTYCSSNKTLKVKNKKFHRISEFKLLKK